MTARRFIRCYALFGFWLSLLLFLGVGDAQANLFDSGNPAYQGTIAYYPMDGNADDASGNGNGGVFRGQPVQAAGVSENCYHFNGADQAIDFAPDFLGTSRPAALTIAAWVYLEDYPSPSSYQLYTIFSREADYSTIQLAIDQAGRLNWYQLNLWMDNSYQSTAEVPLNGWHHVAVTVDASWVRFSIDGQPAGAYPSLGSTYYGYQYVSSIGVNSYYGYPLDFFKGRIDELAIIGRALGEGELLALGKPQMTNQGPLATDDAAETGEDAAVSINVLANDTDADGDALAITDFGQGAHGSVALNADNTFTYTPAANWSGQDSFAYGVSDGKGGTATGGVTVTVQPVNDPPAVGAITGPAQAVMAGNAVNVSAPFSDIDAGDAWTAVWNWGDGSSSPASLDGASGIAAGSHVYAQAGVYDVQLTLTDQAGASATALYRGVTVYDPEAGSVTGVGFLDAPGAKAKVSVSFSSRFQKGDVAPVGHASIQLKKTGLDFSGTTQDWLVLSGAKAIVCGSGTNNGSGDFGYLIVAADGDLIGKKQADRLRVKIWNKASGEVLYDTQPGAADTADPTAAISGGSIVIHK